MKATFKFIHEKFKLNGVHYNDESLLKLADNFIFEGAEFQKIIGIFLNEWFNDSDVLEVQTSGSTGTPKPIKIHKQAMVISALATGEFFGLKPSDTALHCLPTQFIAGKMMLVRALILGLEIDLIAPTSKPVFNTEKPYKFCAMIPLQLENTLQNCHNINTIIVGGASVSTALKEKIQGVNATIFETYGMTETVTHIALKKLNNLNEEELAAASYFKTLPNIVISKDERGCLVINAPKLSEEKIITNDLVALYSETQFEWLGRLDNVINSAGLKLFPEHIEAKLQNKINARFFIASKPHRTLGNQLILVVEAENEKLDASVFSELKKHEKPKHIFTLQKFIETNSGKIHRKKTLTLLNITQ